MFVVMVTGSRKYAEEATVDDALRRVERKHGAGLLIHGAAKGADQLCARVAARRGWQLEPHPVTDWDRPDGSLDRAAGHRRNARMIAREPNGVLAFFQPGERNAGTRGATMLAVKKNIPVVCFWGTEQVTWEQVQERLPS